MNMISGVKEFLGGLMKLNLDKVGSDAAMIPLENDNEGLISRLDIEKKKHRLAIALLGETSSKGYGRLKLNLDLFTSLPSYYMLTKDRPIIDPLVIKVVNFKQDEQLQDSMIVSSNSNNLIVSNNTTPVSIDNVADEEHILRQFGDNSKYELNGAQISGGYETYIALLEKKHEKKGRRIDPIQNTFVIDSIDGAEHTRSKKNISSIISFSTSLTCSDWINSKDVTAGSSLNILTWMQVQGTESLGSMIPSVDGYFKSKKVLRDKAGREDIKRSKYHYYDLHDGKMLYLLTQHSQWNRKFHPFLLCTCVRGDAFRTNHECIEVEHDEQLQLHSRSKRRWDTKVLSMGVDKYTFSVHADWVAEKNKGCSHFGVHPELLPRNGLRFDTFHLKCAITRKLMTFLREFILNQSESIIKDFSKQVLRTIWNDYHLYVWTNEKKFSSFLGNELALFVATIDGILDFLKSNFIEASTILDICQALSLWKKIFKFLGVTYVEDEVNYNDQLKEFEADVTEFYSVGKRSFLTKHGQVGSEETFYTHALRYYMPRIAKLTYERHRTGVGIFTMQGFERRNKESKNCIKRFSNNKGNVVVTNVKRIWDIFNHDINAY